MDRNVFVISGITLSGKSWLLAELLKRPEHNLATVVRMDDIRKKFWGDRPLTNAEGVYRNELTRNEVKRALIIDGVKTVVVEMPMLTRLNHQKPFVDMVFDAEKYIQAIEKENTALLSPSKVRLKVVLAYCSPAAAFARIGKRKSELNISNTNVFTGAQYLSIASRFELPDKTDYVPLPIDTSDESPENAERITSEVSAFLDGQTVIDLSSVYERLQTVRNYLDEAKAEALRRGITELLP